MKINNIKIMFFIGVSIIALGICGILKIVPALFICIGIAIVLGVFMRLILEIYEKVLLEENDKK